MVFNKALEQYTLTYKGLCNYTLFASPFHTLYVPICQTVKVNPYFLCICNDYVHLITIHQVEHCFLDSHSLFL